MKGLLLKDLLNLKKQAKSYLMILAVWLFMAFSTKNALFFSAFVCCYAAMVPITAFSYDERAKWERYALTMPVSRRQLVLSKYALGVVVSLIGFVLSLIVTSILGTPLNESVLLSFAFLSIGLIALSIILPLVFRFGSEKSRIFLILVFLAPTLLLLFFSRLPIPKPSEQSVLMLLRLLPLVGVLALAISAGISVSIFRKKDV